MRLLVAGLLYAHWINHRVRKDPFPPIEAESEQSLKCSRSDSKRWIKTKKKQTRASATKRKGSEPIPQEKDLYPSELPPSAQRRAVQAHSRHKRHPSRATHGPLPLIPLFP